MRDDTFHERKDIGDIGEDIVCNFITSRGLEIIKRSKGYQPEYDIIYKNSDGEIKMIEVKTCNKRSPNLAIEYKSGSKDSGYKSTKSDYYAIVCLKYNTIYVAPTDKFIDYMKFIEDNHKPKKNKTNKSDTWVYLVHKKDFEMTFYTYTY